MKDALGHGSDTGTHSAGIEQLPKKGKLLSDMPSPQLLKAIEKEQAISSKITSTLIEMGHGMARGTEIRQMTGHPIFDQYRANSDRLQELHAEKEARMRYQGNTRPIKRRII